MKTHTTHFKYIEWRNTQGLHEDTLLALSELHFLRDELQFLRDLVTKNTLQLIYGRPFEEMMDIGRELHSLTNRTEDVLKLTEIHGNNLQKLLDDIEVPHELKTYKKEHYRLLMETMDLHADVKKTKRIIFKMLAEIMKQSKSKYLPDHTEN